MLRNTLSTVLFVCLTCLGTTHIFAQRTISGTVTNADDNLGIPGVSIIVKGSSPMVGTTTNLDGQYTIQIPAGYSTLVYTYTGMTTQEKEVAAL